MESKLRRVLVNSLSAHMADYPEATEAIDSMINDLAKSLIPDDDNQGAKIQEFRNEVYAQSLEHTGAPVPDDVTAMLCQAQEAMDGGSFDDEHASMVDLFEHLVGLYDVDTDTMQRTAKEKKA